MGAEEDSSDFVSLARRQPRKGSEVIFSGGGQSWARQRASSDATVALGVRCAHSVAHRAGSDL